MDKTVFAFHLLDALLMMYERENHFSIFVRSALFTIALITGHLTRKSGVLGSIPGLATYFRFSFRFFKKGSCQLLAKVCARSIINRLGGLSLPRKSVVRLTDCPDMTLDVYRGRKTTIQQQQQQLSIVYRVILISTEWLYCS